MDELLSIREFGADDAPSTDDPTLDQTGTLVLFAREAILRQRSAYRPSCFCAEGVSSDRLWTLPPSTALTITTVDSCFLVRGTTLMTSGVRGGSAL
jgi:hypothetical protein